MTEPLRLIPLKSQRPANQLLVSMIIILASASVLLLVFFFLSRIIFGAGINDINLEEEMLSSSVRAYLKLMQLFSQVAFFIVPALLISYLMTGSIREWQGLDTKVSGVVILLVIFLAISMMELTSVTGIINSRMELPSWLGWLEQWIQDKEDAASNLTRHLVYSGNTGGLIVNIFLLAFIPAAGEELMFRGVLQQIIKEWSGSGIISVLLTAVIFSALHFQFYGFLPRFILGVVFGLLFLWSGSVVLPFIAHLVNNLVPVIISHYTGWTMLDKTVNEFVPGGAASVLVMILLPAGLLFLIYYAIRDERKMAGQG